MYMGGGSLRNVHHEGRPVLLPPQVYNIYQPSGMSLTSSAMKLIFRCCGQASRHRVPRPTL